MQPEKTDEEIQGDVRDEVRGEPGLDVADIGVTVERGVVILDGHVPDAAQQRVAEEIVTCVPGVGRPGWNVGVPDDRIMVVVQDGRVRLEGIEGRPRERDAAEVSVCDVVGRGSVESAIVVWPSVTPGRTEDAVKDAPWREDAFDNLA